LEIDARSLLNAQSRTVHILAPNRRKVVKLTKLYTSFSIIFQKILLSCTPLLRKSAMSLAVSYSGLFRRIFWHWA